MHIALLSPGWPPATHPNGIVTYVHCLRQELVARGHKVSIFTGEVDPDVSDRDVHLMKLGTFERVARFVSARVLRRPAVLFEGGASIGAAIKRIHAREPVDVIEMEESFGLVADVAQATGIPTVCKLHGPTFLTQGEAELETEFSQRKICQEGLALRRMPVIVAPSRCTLTATIARYGLRPPIARQIVNPLTQRPNLPLWNLEACDRNTLLFVGRFDMIKGADVLLTAFQRLLADKPELRLVFVGPDTGLLQPGGGVVYLREFVASFKDANLERALSYRGRLDSIDIIELRLSAAITIVASRRETQCYAALEAMLQSCPLVCTDTTGLGELIEHGVTGLKAIPGDAEDLAKQIRHLIDDPQLGATLGRAARDYVLKNHAPGVVAEQMLEVYRGAIDLHRKRAVRAA